MLTKFHSKHVASLYSNLKYCTLVSLLYSVGDARAKTQTLVLSLFFFSFFCTANDGRQAMMTISIAPSSLQKALISVSEQMQIAIYADYELIKDKKVAGVSGRFEVEQLLHLLLQEQQLSFQAKGEGLYVVIPQKKATPKPKPLMAKQSSSSDKHTDIYNMTVIGQRWWSSDNGFEFKKSGVGNNAFLSKDALAQSANSAIADALNILPSVIAYADMRLGQAATGESEYLSIRNMNSDYTSTFINSIRMRGADKSSRSLSLKMITPNSLNSVHILKTPTVEWGAEGIGGVINIVSPNGFDFGRDYLRITSGITYSELADQGDFSAPGQIAQLDIAHLWGDDDEWAIYASAYQQQKYSAAESLEVGDYVVANQAESAISDLRQVREGLQPKDIRFDFYNSLIDRTGGNFSLDYRKASTNLFLRGSVSRYQALGYDVQRKFTRGVDQLYDEKGLFQPIGVNASGYFQTRDYEESLNTLQLGGDTAVRADWHLAYHVAAGQSDNKRPNYVESSLNGLNEPGSFSFDASSPRHIKLSYDSPDTRDYLLDAGSVRVRKFQGSDSGSKNNTYATKWELNHQSLSFLDEIKAGVEYSYSTQAYFNRDMTGNDGENYVIPTAEGSIPDRTAPQGPTGTELAGKNINFMHGLLPDFKVYQRDYFENSLLPLAFHDLYSPSGRPNPGAYTLDDYNRNTISGIEKRIAFYLQGSGQFANFTLVPGLRYEQSHLLATHWDTAGEQHQFSDFAIDEDVWLPNLNITYQHDVGLLFRFAARRAISQPAFGLQAEADSVEYDSLSDQVTSISKANPQLKSERAINYDLSMEWYPNSSSIVEFAFYYKKISRLVYVASLNIIQDKHKVTVNQPLNGQPAQLSGLDIHLRHQFEYLPYFWQNTGLDLSATVQHSWMQNNLPLRTDVTEMPRAPRYNYKLQVFYQSENFMATANWVHTGTQLLNIMDSGLDKYLQASQQFDLSMTLRQAPFAFTLQFENVFNDPSFYKTLGKSTSYLGTQDAGGNGSFVQTGRFAAFFVSYQF